MQHLRSEREAESAPPDETPAADDTRILVLDDDPFQLVVQSCVLRRLGFDRIDTSEKPEAALGALRADPARYEVVVCDLNMPGMDGIEFIRALAAIPFAGQVILVSGEGRRVLHTVGQMLVRERLLILGILEKPASAEAMRALLDRRASKAVSPPRGAAPTFGPEEVSEAARARQWVLHYQPKIDMRTGRLAGVEALVRWNHPRLGLVYPEAFIGVAEDCGAIDALTEWVLRESTRQLAAWKADKLGIGMAVNVSMENLGSAGFARSLAGIVREAGVSPADLTLEITESRLMSPTPVPLESLVRLRMQRFKLSIDDFGTGHSSLVQLRDVPFTELKLDRSFVQGARLNPVVRPILEGSVGMARRLDMKSVAEGVETEDDWQLMREIGCDLAQGYFIGRPMPAEGVAAWNVAWQGRRQQLIAG